MPAARRRRHAARPNRHGSDVCQAAVMRDEPAVLLASGRSADVFDLGDGTVLRRFRQQADCGPEARVMQWLVGAGLPVPQVRRANGADMLVDKVDGPTMFDDLMAHPWRVVAHARTLAALQLRLNALVAPDWLSQRVGVPPGDAVLHLDFHPLNVMLGSGGPVVIDWTNASRGRASFDGAMSVAIMATFDAPTRRAQVLRAVLVRAFMRARGPALVRGSLVEACRYRLRDRNLTDRERAALQRLTRRYARSSSPT
jgi:aminoglycoside/choline kinase family phosphotransferase